MTGFSSVWMKSYSNRESGFISIHNPILTLVLMVLSGWSDITCKRRVAQCGFFKGCQNPPVLSSCKEGRATIWVAESVAWLWKAFLPLSKPGAGPFWGSQNTQNQHT